MGLVRVIMAEIWVIAVALITHPDARLRGCGKLVIEEIYYLQNSRTKVVQSRWLRTGPACYVIQQGLF
jgi:hypothetical protein